MTAPEDLVNQALREIGYGKSIGNLYDGSRASRAALEIYRQSRQELLDSGEWSFARRGNVALSLLKGPPPPGGYSPLNPWSTAYPPPGFLYEYAYPADCLELKAVLAAPGAMFELDPQPAVWRIDNDTSFETPQKVILCNLKGALGVYIADITDPDLWEPGFTMTMVGRLKTKLAMALGGNLDVEKQSLAETAAAHTTEAQRG